MVDDPGAGDPGSGDTGTGAGDFGTGSAGVSVLIPGVLRPLIADQDTLRLDIAGEDVTVAELLDTIATRYPVFDRRIRDETGALRRYVNVYVAGDDVRRLRGLHTPVRSGQEILLIQSVAGG